MKKIRLTESGLKGFVRAIVEQVEGEYYHMEPGQFLTMLTAGVNRMDIVTKLKRFQGKPVWIDGDLDLSSKPITTLGNLAGVSGDLNLSGCKKLKDLGGLQSVTGKLDISRSSVSSIDGVEYGSISAYDSEFENKEIRREYNAKFAEMQADREEGTFDDPSSSEEAAKRWALLQHLSNNDSSVMIRTDEVNQEYYDLKQRLELLQDRYNETDDDETVDSLQDEIDEAETRIEEIETEYFDVYDIVDSTYGNYGMSGFIVRHFGGFRNPNEYSVGTTDEADRALDDYWDNYIDDVGIDGFNESTLEDHIDGDNVAEDFRDYYDDDIRENLEGYFNMDKLDYTDDQEREIATLQHYIDELETYISDLEEQQTSMEFDTDNEDEYNRQQEELQLKIDDAEEKRDETQDKIDGIEPEIDEDMIESEIESRLDDIRRDPLSFLKEHGYDMKTIKNYIDMDSLKKELRDDSDYGSINSYDGEYDEIDIAGDSYIVMRTN